MTAGTFDTSTHNIDITGTTTISSGGTLTHGTGTKIHNGNVVIDEGGVWTETAAAAVDFLGHVTNNGTFTASTGLHRFLNFTRTINGTFSIPNVTVIGDAEYTNTGTLTISTLLGGNGELINGADATLNIGDDEIDDAEDGFTFTASAVGNTVNYNRAGAQTVKIPTGSDYDNLTLSGSGTKSVASALTIAGDLSIESGSKASLTGDSTSNRLFLNESLQVPGTFGSSSSDAGDKNNTYFSGTGKVTVAIGSTPRSASSSGSMIKAKVLTNTPTDLLLLEDKKFQDLLAQLQDAQSVVPPKTNLACNPFIRLGSRGENVKTLQSRMGLLLVDGIFGSQTYKALKEFQISKGIVVDGIAGPETCSLL